MSDIVESVSKTAATETAAPRKRRRPALSCEQCRRRKIKCDRNYPCTQCLQSKTAHCSYSPGSAGASRHRSKLGLHQDTIQQNFAIPNRSRNVPSTSSSSQLPSDGSSPKITLSDGSQTSWHSPISEHLHDDTSSKALLDRIQTLERKLAHATNQDQPQHDESRIERPKEMSSEASVRNPDMSDSYLESTRYGSPGLILEQKERLRGTVSKTRFFGRSHWMYSYGTFDRISCLKVNPKNNTPELTEAFAQSDVNEVLQRCKSMARAAKAGPHNQFLMNPNYRDSVPPRLVSDKLIQLYLRTHEGTLRIIHIPTFYKEYEQYWANPAAASSTIVLKMLLMMSIGSCFYQDDDQNWHSQALQWIFAGQSWLASPFEKGRLHISGLQIHCLVLVSRLANAVAGDLVWISAGSLVRTAFQMGFHRDPRHLPKMLPLHAELRRRLWVTIVELNAQAALDSGMPNLLNINDFDTELPLNIDDADIDEIMTEAPLPKPKEIYTQTSLQIMLHDSIETRIEVIRHANNIRSDPTYEETLALGSALTSSMREHNSFINTVNAEYLQNPMQGKCYISRLHRNILDLFVRRFLLSLHRPFAAQAQSDLRYYFSRKVCLDSAMVMLTYPPADPHEETVLAGQQDDFTRYKTMSGGFQKGLLVHTAMIIFSELLAQIREESTFTEQSRAAREPLKQALRDIVELSAERIAHAENNVKGHLFISVVLAQIEASERGIPSDKLVLEAARNSAQICSELLSKRIPSAASDDDYARHVENGSALDGVGINTFQQGQAYDLMPDVMMQDWPMDARYFTAPDSWLLSGWEDNQPWGLQV